MEHVSLEISIPRWCTRGIHCHLAVRYIGALLVDNDRGLNAIHQERFALTMGDDDGVRDKLWADDLVLVSCLFGGCLQLPVEIEPGRREHERGNPNRQN